MTLIVDGHAFHYEMENLCRLFFPYEKIKVVREPSAEDEMLVYTGVKPSAEGERITVRAEIGSFRKEAADLLSEKEACEEKEPERRMAVLLFRLLAEYSGVTPKWGILTGVRPVKLMRRLTQETGEASALRRFREKFLVSEEKTALCLAAMRGEEKILRLSRPESFSLYIGIPFCPTRCAYCSFVSSSVEKAAGLVPEYLRLLQRELIRTAQIAQRLRLRLESVYIGGGTPTTLSAEQLDELIGTVNRWFGRPACGEFTVEAGRPDTITPEKLAALQRGGVTRISINPQTLNDRVLRNIGRRHTAQQTLSAFALARETGFSNINMDLIAGLPGDSAESFSHTMDRILKLTPESVTVHTLSLKRSSRIFQEHLFHDDSKAAGEMLDYAGARLTGSGYAPYYLYRQSRMVGNLENTGWARPGFESPYNVFIMDETHTILACGAGASTKIKDPDSDFLERIFNFKYPYEYINRFSEIMKRKDRVTAVYEKIREIPQRAEPD